MDAITPRLAIIGGGPAGLMAAEMAANAGIGVDVFESKGSVGRKFLIAGKGGLNLTHSEPFDDFVSRYGARSGVVRDWLINFDADNIRQWARGLGVETFVGSSGRVFPSDLKAAPLLRAWVRRLRERGVRFYVQHRCLGWNNDGALRFLTPEGEKVISPSATVLALGGASWPQLGSDGAWQHWSNWRGTQIYPLLPSNCGFDLDWSAHFAERHAGHPVKPVRVSWVDSSGALHNRQGEFVITSSGIEGSLIYAFSAAWRDMLAATQPLEIRLDLTPGRDLLRVQKALLKPRGHRSVSDHLRRNLALDSVKIGLLYEIVPKSELSDPMRLAVWIKALPIKLIRPRPVAEAISSAGGVAIESLNEHLMLPAKPGVFCAGEMLDWEAPTGGYLLSASLASGRVAGLGAADWLKSGAFTKVTKI